MGRATRGAWRAAPSGRSERSSARSDGNGTAWRRCACGSAASARQSVQIAIRSPPMNTCTAFRLKHNKYNQTLRTMIQNLDQKLTQMSRKVRLDCEGPIKEMCKFTFTSRLLGEDVYKHQKLYKTYKPVWVLLWALRCELLV